MNVLAPFVNEFANRGYLSASFYRRTSNTPTWDMQQASGLRWSCGTEFIREYGIDDKDAVNVLAPFVNEFANRGYLSASFYRRTSNTPTWDMQQASGLRWSCGTEFIREYGIPDDKDAVNALAPFANEFANRGHLSACFYRRTSNTPTWDMQQASGLRWSCGTEFIREHGIPDDKDAVNALAPFANEFANRGAFIGLFLSPYQQHPHLGYATSLRVTVVMWDRIYSGIRYF